MPPLRGKVSGKAKFYVFDAFGERITTVNQDKTARYTDHEFDTFTDWNYMKARFSTPAATGKFNRPDPARDWDWTTPGSLNLYQYVRNNPITALDPSGLGKEEALKIYKQFLNVFQEARRLTARNKREYHGTFFMGRENGNVTYATNGPLEGRSHSVTPDYKTNKPDGFYARGAFHTHSHVLWNEYAPYVKDPLYPSPGDTLEYLSNPTQIRFVVLETVVIYADITDEEKAKKFMSEMSGKKDGEIIETLRASLSKEQIDARKKILNSGMDKVLIYGDVKVGQDLGITYYQITGEGESLEYTEITLEELEKEDRKL